jgi:hypothetical protein
MRPTARRDGYRAPGLADMLFPGFAAAIDNIAPGFEKSALTANFAHDDAPAQSLEPQQFPATPLRRARAFATITA